MKGAVFIIRPDHATRADVERRDVTSAPDLAFLASLQELCGGHLTAVPHFSPCPGLIGDDSYCVAFCNEDGTMLELPYNPLASTLWHLSAPAHRLQVLVGTVVVVTGDAEFMREL